jgi:hypothetical protein
MLPLPLSATWVWYERTITDCDRLRLLSAGRGLFYLPTSKSMAPQANVIFIFTFSGFLNFCLTIRIVLRLLARVTVSVSGTPLRFQQHETKIHFFTRVTRQILQTNSFSLSTSCSNAKLLRIVKLNSNMTTYVGGMTENSAVLQWYAENSDVCMRG